MFITHDFLLVGCYQVASDPLDQTRQMVEGGLRMKRHGVLTRSMATSIGSNEKRKGCFSSDSSKKKYRLAEFHCIKILINFVIMLYQDRQSFPYGSF